jgi:two-component system NtrC family sensor kinase
LFSSLGVRLLIPLLLIVAVVLSIHALTSFRAMKDHFQRFAASEADRSSAFIRRATHDGMLLNRLDEVQATIEHIAEEPEISAIRIYDKQGRIVLSSDRREIGRRASVSMAPCSKCHAPVPASGEALEAATVARSVEENVVRQLSVLVTEQACQASGCHKSAATEKVLGVLEVEMSMVPFEYALLTARKRLILTTLQLMLVIGIVASLFVQRVISLPIRRLKAGTRRIAGGDLSTRIDVRGRHELAALAHDFNRMAEDLSRSHREVREWSHKLEEKVIKKTNELQAAQKQVLHMEKMASLGKLSATVAHELNNPISGMLTYARLIERELDDQPLDDAVRLELRRCLHLVQSECSRCGKIVQNLLVFARSNATDLAPTDMNEVVRRSLMLISHQLEISRIRLAVQYLAGDSEIVTDAGQLEQALVALFINAAEAMNAGGQLAVELRGNTTEVEIDVCDTGIGIPADILPHIFEPFFSTKNESGSGLGLAVVYGIVHRHGGAIEVASKVGVGTTFHLRFPRHSTTDAEPLDRHLTSAGATA